MTGDTPRRWTIREDVCFKGEWSVHGPKPKSREQVEVMPVAEHEAELRAALTVTDEMCRTVHERMFDYWHVDHHWDAIGSGWKDAMRAALVAALNGGDDA